jgi:CRP-like cAMP-binding protein
VTTDSDSTFQFDVALSFAGEDRAFVDTIAVRLRAHRVKVFYDRYEKATLWGKDLYEHLDHVYQRAARYCVLFVSEHYARKVWTNHERKSAQRPTVGYIDARSTTSDELVDLILQKVQRPSEQVVPIAARVRVPRTAEQRRPLLAQQPPAWEYLLFAGVLAQGKEALEPKWRDHQLRYVRRAGPALSDAEVPNFINGAFRELAGLTSNLERILDVDAKERAFGPLGVPGNPVHIEHLGQRLLEMYEGLLDWSARIRGTPTSDHFSRALQLLASYADNPIAEMRAFIDRYMDETSRLSERLANQDDDDEPIQVVMYITFEIDEHVSREFSREMKRLRRRGLLR